MKELIFFYVSTKEFSSRKKEKQKRTNRNSFFWSHGYPIIPYCLFNIANDPFVVSKQSCHGDRPVGSTSWCGEVKSVSR